MRYRRRTGTHDSLVNEPGWQELTGTVAGPSLHDVHANTTWTPIRPSDNTAIQLIRAQDILDAKETPDAT
ncbi:hypothetical protein OG943_14225 [Amycolatopsis sp. NBC_00345]|uniref:hypothetical protein n=1 Tax=Amycolatopsis sp. NBC_00345 TaxID=2975955 RepID=UPI002E258E3F